MKRLIFWACTLGLCCSAPTASALVVCYAVPTSGLGVDEGGTVVTWVEGNGMLKLCSLEEQFGTVGAKTCAGWYSTLLTARSARAKVALYLNETRAGNAGITTCNTLGAWSARSVYYIEYLQ
jgi:hypothetical protein